MIDNVSFHEKKIGRWFDIFLFIALMGSSMLGAQAFGVSINKLALIPLEVYLIWNFISNRRNVCFYKICIPLFVFYFAQLAGSFVGLLDTAFTKLYASYHERLFNNILQTLIIYLPILICLSAVRDKDRIYGSLKKNIVIVARIHLFWVLGQFIAWYVLGIDLNEFVFHNILNNFLGEAFSSATVINLNGKIQLRATGINYEPAAMALIMVAGICFDRRILFKLLYFAATILGMSRTGIVVAFISLVSLSVIWVRRNWNRKFSSKQVSKALAIAGIFFVVAVISIIAIPYLREQLLNAVDRFLNMGSNKDGSERHVLYPLVSIYSWFNDLNFFEKMFGVGGRVSGLVLVHSPYVSGIMSFNQTMLTDAWEIECDYAAILLGNGLVGFIGYILVIVGLIKTRNPNIMALGISVLIYGVMYNAFTATLLQVVCIILFCSFPQRKECLNHDFHRKMNRDRSCPEIPSIK